VGLGLGGGCGFFFVGFFFLVFFGVVCSFCFSIALPDADLDNA